MPKLRGGVWLAAGPAATGKEMRPGGRAGHTRAQGDDRRGARRLVVPGLHLRPRPQAGLGHSPLESGARPENWSKVGANSLAVSGRRDGAQRGDGPELLSARHKSEWRAEQHRSGTIAAGRDGGRATEVRHLSGAKTRPVREGVRTAGRAAVMRSAGVSEGERKGSARAEGWLVGPQGLRESGYGDEPKLAHVGRARGPDWGVFAPLPERTYRARLTAAAREIPRTTAGALLSGGGAERRERIRGGREGQQPAAVGEHPYRGRGAGAPGIGPVRSGRDRSGTLGPAVKEADGRPSESDRGGADRRQSQRGGGLKRAAVRPWRDHREERRAERERLEAMRMAMEEELRLEMSRW